MRRLFLAILTLSALASLPSGVASAASPYGTFPNCVNPFDAYESQVWDIDTDEHIHTGVCFPMFADAAAPTSFDIRTLLHNNDGHANFVRWGVHDGGVGGYVFRGDFPGSGLNEVGVVHEAPWNPADGKNSGFKEFRFTSNVEDPAKGRWYTTARYTLNFVNGKGRDDYSGGPTTKGRCGGGGHYGDYHIAWIDCRDLARIRQGPVPSGFVVNLRWQNGQRAFANLDPGFHNGNPGTVLYDGPADPVAVPVHGAPGWHKLHIRVENHGQKDENGNPGRFAGAFVTPILIG
jgi:hypothetical protein